MADDTRRKDAPADLGSHRERTAADLAEENEASRRATERGTKEPDPDPGRRDEAAGGDRTAGESARERDPDREG